MDTIWCKFSHSKYLFGLIQKKLDSDDYRDDGSIDCFLKVDFDYNDESHVLLNDYPLSTKKNNLRVNCLIINYKS